MAQPSIYARGFNYTPLAPANVPEVGDRLNIEFDTVASIFAQHRANLGLIQRDDGRLANQAVHPESLSNRTRAMVAGQWILRGSWLTGTAYVASDVVMQSGAFYACVVPHTSGVFSSDLSAGRWMLWYEEATFSEFGQSLVLSADAAAARGVLGATATGSAVFTAADAAAARGVLGTTATGSAVFTAADAAAARGAIGAFPAGGGTLSGDLTIAKTTPLLRLDDTGGSATIRAIEALRNGARVWQIGADLDAHGGGNVGSTLFVRRFDDAGAALGDAIRVARATGVVTFSALPLLSQAPTLADHALRWGSAPVRGWASNAFGSNSSTTSTSYVDTGHAITYTPKFAGSWLFVQAFIPRARLDRSSNTAVAGTFQIWDTSGIAGDQALFGYQTTGGAGTLYLQQPIVLSGMFHASTTATRQFNIQFAVVSPDGTIQTSADNGPTRMIVMEFAP